MEIFYQDNQICVCRKPAGVLSTDEPGGMPSLLREALGSGAVCVRTVHRLDRVVSGLMVFALTPEAASALSAQIRDGSFGKTYLAVVHGVPEPKTGTMTDLLWRDRYGCKTLVVTERAKGVQEAILDYETLQSVENASLVRITLRTGRTHQIRAQFSSRALPLFGDKKYGLAEDTGSIALFSAELRFSHPASGTPMQFAAEPPQEAPWTLFSR